MVAYQTCDENSLPIRSSEMLLNEDLEIMKNLEWEQNGGLP